MVNIKIKKLSEEAKIPTQANDYDAGYDVYSKERVAIKPLETVLIKTGIAVEIPEGYEIQVRTKSGMALKEGLFVLNSPGTIDTGYRGEVGVILKNIDMWSKIINKGEMVAQLVLNELPKMELEEVEELSESVRSEKGFGSTKENDSISSD